MTKYIFRIFSNIRIELDFSRRKRVERKLSSTSCHRFVDRHSAHDFRDTTHIRITLSAKSYISIRHSGKAASIRAAVPDMRYGGGAPKKERERDAVVVGIRIHEWGDISYAWLPSTALLGSMGLTSPYDKIA